MNVQIALHLPRDAASVPTVRKICKLTMESLEVDGEDVGDVTLALTEACANVIDHAAAGHDYDVTLGIDGITCTIRVDDRGGDQNLSACIGQPSIGDWDSTESYGWNGAPSDSVIEALLPSGRGIALMENLMDTLRFTPIDGGTSVELVKVLSMASDSPLLTLIDATRPAAHPV